MELPVFCLLITLFVPISLQHFHLQNLNEHFGLLIVKLDELEGLSKNEISAVGGNVRSQRQKSRQLQKNSKLKNYKPRSSGDFPLHNQSEGDVSKTSNDDYKQQYATKTPQTSKGFASHSGGREKRRQYDVPQIECPPAVDGMERFSCPTPDRQGNFRCVDDHVLCDGYFDCPEGEDESSHWCMFYKTTKAHLNILAETLLKKLTR